MQQVLINMISLYRKTYDKIDEIILHGLDLSAKIQSVAKK